VAFVLSESDHGVATAERMHAAVGAPGNGVNPTRRNKWMTNEALRERGVGHTKQVFIVFIHLFIQYIITMMYLCF